MHRARVRQIFLTAYNLTKEKRDVICHCEHLTGFSASMQKKMDQPRFIGAKEPQAAVAISNFAIRKPFIFLGEAQRRSNLNRKHWNRPVRFVWKNSLVGVLGFTKFARAKDW